MKFLLSLIFLATAVSLSAQEVEWMSMNEALEAQKEADEPKKIFLDVYTDWCGPCKLLDRRTFGNKDVAEYLNENYYPVKFNAEGTEKVTYQDFTYTNPNYDPSRRGRNSQHFFANALKISGYPSMVFFDEDSKIISSISGYKTPRQLEVYLKMVASNDYKEITTKKAWKEYQKNFDNSFSTK